MTTANTTAQIATFLNVAPNAIKSVTEMAWVFCVVVRGQRARFVSKKVVKGEIEMLTLEKFQELTNNDMRPNRVTDEMLKLAVELKGADLNDALMPWDWQAKQYPALASTDLDDRQIKNVIIAASQL